MRFALGSVPSWCVVTRFGEALAQAVTGNSVFVLGGNGDNALSRVFVSIESFSVPLPWRCWPYANLARQAQAAPFVPAMLDGMARLPLLFVSQVLLMQGLGCQVCINILCHVGTIVIVHGTAAAVLFSICPPSIASRLQGNHQHLDDCL